MHSCGPICSLAVATSARTEVAAVDTACSRTTVNPWVVAAHRNLPVELTLQLS